MKFSTTSICAFVALTVMASVDQAFATTTLTFSKATVGRATGFANNAGVATDGMRFGMIISTTDNNFSGGSYDVFNTSVSGFLSVGGVATDDYYFTAASLPTTSTQASTTTAGGTDPGGAGGIVSVALAPNGTDGSITGLTTSDRFALVWFDGTAANGSHYGMLTDSTFQIPASGTSVDFTPFFAGTTADPIKPANLTFGAAPEPSRALLLSLGGLGLLVRRRRI